MPQLTCRFYKNRFPDTNDLVMVNVTQIQEMGVYVNLLEYNNQQGMIQSSELSRRRIRSVNKLIRVGRNEIAVVLRVDQKNGYIDLSKRQVSPDDANRCEEKFAHGKTVNSILRHTAEILGIQTNDEFEVLYEKTAWFYDEKLKQNGAAYNVFAQAVSNEHALDDCPIDDNTKKALLSNIRHRLTPAAVKCRADIEVACYGYEGVDAVKAALKQGMIVSTEEMPIKINLIAPPLYVLTANCNDGNVGIEALKKAMEMIEKGIKSYNGIYKVKMEPRVVTNIDEVTLQEAMIAAAEDNAEKPGDDTDNSDEIEDGGIAGEVLGAEAEEPSETTKTTTSQKDVTFEEEDDDDNDDDKD